jgi:4,5-DOPA dioxygenase extradiol
MAQLTLFVSHGAPDIVISDTEARRFFERDLPRMIEKPDAIVIASAHFEADRPLVVSDENPGMIYDFGGFDSSLYEMVYPASGDAALAGRVAALLNDIGIEAELLAERGFDHGTWTPLMLVFPEADVPVIQISIDPEKDAHYHYMLGRSLASLRDENILIMGSGHITHNLRAIFATMRGGAGVGEMPQKVAAFTGWLAEKLAEKDRENILDWQQRAPFALENHPTPEHLMPLFFAYGAAGKDADAKRLHSSTQYGYFQSDVWAFQ